MKKNKSTITKNRRLKILDEFEKKAKKQKMRFSYETAKKIDLIAKETKKPVKKVFQEIVKESKERKQKYIEKKYKVKKEEAKKILQDSIKKNINYSLLAYDLKVTRWKKEQIEKDEKLPILYQSWLDFINTTESKINIREDCTVSVIIGENKWLDIPLEKFNNFERLEARKILESDFPDIRGKKKQYNYAVVNAESFAVKTLKDDNFQTYKIVAEFLPDQFEAEGED